VLRLVVREVQVDGDRIVIKHSIAPTNSDPGSGYRLRGRSSPRFSATSTSMRWIGCWSGPRR
jgi:hypothetical protein